MTRLMILAPLLLAAAVPALADTPDDAKARTARNWDVMLSQYPERARAAREQGPVGFRVRLDGDGYATECQVTSSSGYPLLDEETCRLLMSRGDFKGISDGNGRRTNAVVDGVLNWQLPRSTASAAAPAAAPPVRTASAALPGKRICRRQAKTGSLAGFERICMSKAEWDRHSDEQRAMWQEVQGTKGSTKGN
jgi:TonB family protein